MHSLPHAYFSDQSLALRSDDFLGWSQIGKVPAVGGHRLDALAIFMPANAPY